MGDIRAPHRWNPPSTPIMPKGKATVVNVSSGSPGSVIQVPYADAFIKVNVPANARPGQAMLVPVPDVVGAAGEAVGGAVLDAVCDGLGDFKLDFGKDTIDAAEDWVAAEEGQTNQS